MRPQSILLLKDNQNLNYLKKSRLDLWSGRFFLITMKIVIDMQGGIFNFAEMNFQMNFLKENKSTV